jgi:cell division protein FtsW
MLILSVILLILVLIPGIGVERNAARRWLLVGHGPLAVSFQPSELGKWAALFFVLAACHRARSALHSFGRQLLPILGVSGILIGLVAIEDFGTAAFIAILVLIGLIAGGARLRHIAALTLAGICLFSLLLLAEPYRVQRVMAFSQPNKWADSVGYQADQSLIALASGGPFGKGLGNGVSKYGHLPEDTTDFVFAVIGEELGFVGTTTVIILFGLLVALGLKITLGCPDPFGKLMAFGITAALGLQAGLNIGVVAVVLPTKGIPLPFVSSGGTSLILSSAAVGILMGIARQSNQARAASACGPMQT